VSSDLARASRTAAALAERTGHEVLLDPRLRETDGGSWEGRRGPEIAQDDPERYLAWRRGADVPAGGAETRSQVAERARAAVVEHLTGLPAGGQLVVVTHGGTARSLLGSLLGLPVDLWRTIGALSNASWSVAEEGRTGWWLAEHNAGSLPTPVLGDDR
jgi:glucosyl-3-phosphoglycerate phosphatase